jgi:cyclic AMP-dependent transcription factor ATF-4
MFFDFNPSTELLTPTINHGGVDKTNPIFASSNASSLDENDDHFPSLPSEKNEYELTTEDNINENNDNNQQQDDLFSTFEFPVFSELDKYITEVSYPSPSMDAQNSLLSDDSTFFPIDESALVWVGGECTVESGNTEDMTVPPSPPLSSASGSSSTAEKRSTKKRSLSTTERKLRKKDQNKTAAEKYRFKKRTERNELITRHLQLKNQNQELKFEFENLTYRLEQFKNLFTDVLQIPIPSTK